MKKVAAVFASALMSVSMAGFATPEAGDKSFSISGTGASDKEFDGNAYGISGELGFYATEHLLWGVRQSFNGLVGDEVSDSWSGSTRGFVDYHFGSGDARPYVGANIGGIYGENTKDTGIAGLEVGVRWFVQEKTFIGFGMEYAYLFDDSDDIDSSFDDGAFFYTLGVGFNF